MSGITTHVLDLAAGRPASGVQVKLEVYTDDRGWIALSEKLTDAEGRVKELLSPGSRLDPGRYRLTFATGPYFDARGQESFHPEAAITFEVADPSQHYHVPLLVSPFGYSTYRGS